MQDIYRERLSFARIIVITTLAMIGVVAPICCSGAANLDIEIVLTADQTGVPIPVCAEVGKRLSAPALSSERWCLEETPAGRTIPCQIDAANGSIRFIVETPPGDKSVTKRYRLRSSVAAVGGVRIEHSEDRQLAITDNGAPVLVYNYRNLLPEGVPEIWKRSSYIHPIYDLDGAVLTDDFPADHYHHRGLSWMWTKVRMGGEQHDLWALRGIRQRFERLLVRDDGPVSGKLRLANGWYTDDGRKWVSEDVSIEVFRASSAGRVIDIELSFQAVSAPVWIDSSDTGYGGLNLRFAPRRDTAVMTSKGRMAADVNRERFLWSDLSARFGESSEFSGVALFDHPENPSHPAGWSNRYYGNLNPSFTAVEPVTIGTESPLRARYRVWVHRGDSDSGLVTRAYQAYMNPPVVRVL